MAKRVTVKIEDKLWEMALDQHGYVTSADAREIGINPIELNKLAGRHRLEHAGHGIFRFEKFPTSPLASYMAAVLWTRREGVLSHDTALLLHELCDINPAEIHLTIPGRRPRRSGGDLIVTHHGRLNPADITLTDGIPIVRPPVAIAQGIETGVRSGLIRDAIIQGRRQGKITAGDELRLIEQLQLATE